MTSEETRREKAKNLRYKKPIAACMNLQFIYDTLYEMEEAVSEVQWADNDTLYELLGSDDEAWEFKMAFTDLTAELEKFRDDLSDEYVPDCFDELFPAAHCDFFGGYLGFDSFEGDYYGLMTYENEWAEKEAESRITRLTKKDLLDAVQVCLKVYSSFVALKYRYDCLSCSLDILRDDYMERLKTIKGIEELYEKADKESNGFQFSTGPAVREYERALQNLHQEYWL